MGVDSLYYRYRFFEINYRLLPRPVPAHSSRVREGGRVGNSYQLLIDPLFPEVRLRIRFVRPLTHRRVPWATLRPPPN
jgi:hypothetical protein